MDSQRPFGVSGDRMRLTRSQLKEELRGFHSLAAQAREAGLSHLPAMAQEEADALRDFMQDACEDIDE